MKRIATATKHVDKFGGGKHGFRNGDPLTGTPATALEDTWCDHVQEEIANVIEGFGVALDAGQRDQLFKVIQANVGAYDTPFLAGWGADFAGEDLAAQGYGIVPFVRNLKLVGDLGVLLDAPTGADLTLDFEVNGVSIYASRPKFAAAGTVYTPGILTNVNGVDVNVGQYGIFKVEGIGSVNTGKRLAWALKGHVR